MDAKTIGSPDHRRVDFFRITRSRGRQRAARRWWIIAMTISAPPHRADDRATVASQNTRPQYRRTGMRPRNNIVRGNTEFGS
ncbi:MAG: hypothetical protein ACP5QA_07765 [Phycisphaerae bacterium]